MLTIKVAMSRSTIVLVTLLFLSSTVLLAGCGHFRTKRSTTFASHKVTIDRHGPTHRFAVENRGQLDILHYDGYCLTGERLQVKIENDKVMVNNKDVGMLKTGDAVHIGDDGLTVNSLDYGQTEKYLQEHLKQFVSQNIDK
jgi:hypothetical protein